MASIREKSFCRYYLTYLRHTGTSPVFLVLWAFVQALGVTLLAVMESHKWSSLRFFCLYVYVSHGYSVHGGQKRVSDPMALSHLSSPFLNYLIA